jgi:hypothetical protein
MLKKSRTGARSVAQGLKSMCENPLSNSVSKGRVNLAQGASPGLSTAGFDDWPPGIRTPLPLMANSPESSESIDSVRSCQ